ncbi:hypothetical protein Athai_17650 [Actinocatenispora thailandica]|uniref:GH18 domain-containing protein n=1 Tax=Actinocatenispora thailandica TaxID=227318 RepID=A0A7R7DMU5_9ACTN|nr:hypothetical protein [Actinocatenispora thailandica]BCJ34262.1 hypothetical protein Athai_17650 [Actinocatenispora thailandica]
MPRLLPRRRWPRRALLVALGLAAAAVLVAAAGAVALQVEGSGTPAPTARGTGHDAEWLGHAWVDGRKSQSDVDALAARLRHTGIRDLYVHAGPFRDDGSLDRSQRPRARWLVTALHRALPGVRVQAWLGAHPVPGQLRLGSARTRATILASLRQVLRDGFDGVHYDFEPVADGDADLVTLLAASHRATRRYHAVLSLSASLLAPVPGLASTIRALPGGPRGVWSPGYLRRLAGHVDQVAVMLYDSCLPTATSYAGYVRRATGLALGVVPGNVALLIGVPAYHDRTACHRGDAETMAAALRGVRLALGHRPRRRTFGVALYVDFAATAADWASYRTAWS